MNELAKRAFISYEASELPVSDHRMVSATFRWENCKGLATQFRMPRDMSQLGIDGQCFADARVPVACQLHFDQAVQSGCIDNMWASYVAAMEQVAQNVVRTHGSGPIPTKFLGKAKCKFVKVQNVAPVIAKGRNDAFQAEVQDCGVQLRKRIMQIRRIDAFVAQCRARCPMTQRRAQAVQSTWNAVVHVRGFGKNFPEWYIAEFDSPFPLGPPDLATALWVRQCLADKVPQWRSYYNNTPTT